MPNSITFTTDDPVLAGLILQVIQGGGAAPKPAAAAAAEAPPAAPLPTPSMAGPPPPHAGNSAAPPQPSQFAGPPTGMGVGNPQTSLQQAIEATNAALDKYLQAHKAQEAKVILQKYGLKRISDATDPAVLANLFREFSGQAVQ